MIQGQPDPPQGGQGDDGFGEDPPENMVYPEVTERALMVLDPEPPHFRDMEDVHQVFGEKGEEDIYPDVVSPPL